jgi:hypothetical protein
MVLTNSVFVGVILIVLSVMSEYVGQILIEAKGRPNSIIYQYIPAKNAVERENTDEIR